ncbi:MAG: thioredoxin-disulfide reductase [Candidatus Omnitrophica bacterium CG11_big_fil_rev_8_21_14_0_20_41_12]|nr:MAG: thioredoxin-disulfide reductase [Candidatus Omnitrophica bacterium CG11_big_fil_rev_8_21_14_0_20_41_12]
MYDLIIIGAGPAGITASVYAARKKLNFLVISLDIGGQTAWSGDIENYTGYQFITGPELTEKFQEHLRKYDIALKENEEVLELVKSAEVISVNTNKGNYQSRTVIIASGKKSRELGVPGEKEFKNHGLTYCATCDGPLFSAKTVAVIGGGNSAMDAALQLTKIAKHIYIINITEKLAGDQIMFEKIKQAQNVTILNNHQIMAITGDKFVRAIKIKNKDGQKELAVEGVFVEIGLIPNSVFAKNVEKNTKNEINIDLTNQTNIPGVFAAGDVTNVLEKQIIIAAGEGSKAALSAYRYLAKNKF